MVKGRSAIPRGYQAVMPYLRVRDAASAIKFYKKAFGATESFRLKMAGKIGHAELEISGAVVMLSDEFPDAKALGPKALKGTTVHLTVYVEDVDKAVAKAVKAGARIRRPVADQFYGDRSGQIEDPFGHVWSLQTRIEKVSPKDMQKRLDALMRSGGEPARKVARASRVSRAARKPARRSAAKAVRRPAAKRSASRKVAPARRAGSARRAAKRR